MVLCVRQYDGLSRMGLFDKNAHYLIVSKTLELDHFREATCPNTGDKSTLC